VSAFMLASMDDWRLRFHNNALTISPDNAPHPTPIDRKTRIAAWTAHLT
jgi:hypothetical protein